MKRRHTAAAAAYILLTAALAGILIATTALNVLKKYEEVRTVEFFIAPTAAVIAAVALLENGKDRLKENITVLAALIFTTCADYVMVILNTNYPLSLAFFSAAQLCYYARILCIRADKKYFAVSGPVRAGICAAGVIAAALVVPDGTLTAALAVFYFLNLLLNFAEAACLCKRAGRYIVFATGLLLFIGCDVCVGLNAADIVGIRIPSDWRFAINIIIWLFYVPSQTLIALSAAMRDRTPCGKGHSTCG